MRFFHRRRSSRTRKAKWIFLSVLAGIFFVFLLWFLSVLGPFRGFFWYLPSSMGFFGEKQYLILIQNNNELRPTGGFISAYAILKTRFGKPSLDFHDSYEIAGHQYVSAPTPIEYLFGDDPFYQGWVFRDANFSPDFVESANQAETFYNYLYPDQQFDGIFAVDFTIRKLTRTLGRSRGGGGKVHRR